jgi:hypothetical protein
MPGLPNSLLLFVMVAIFCGYANSTFVNYTGHVYCNVSTADGSSNTTEGSILLPVKNVDMTLMEIDGWFSFRLTEIKRTIE